MTVYEEETIKAFLALHREEDLLACMDTEGVKDFSFGLLTREDKEEIVRDNAVPFSVRTYETRRDPNGEDIVGEPDMDVQYFATVSAAVEWLRKRGFCYPSCAPSWSEGTWYSTEPEQCYKTGEWIEKSAHVEGLLSAEYHKEIYEGVNA